MKGNKNKKVFIIAIIAIVLILLIGVVYAFLATDTFKSNKDLFFEYASQIFDEDGFIDNKIEQYSEKKKNSAYENEGKFTANVDSQSMDSNILKNINSLNISFVGNTDNLNNRSESLTRINYTNDVEFPIYYKNINGFHGIKMTRVAKNTYFAVQEDEIGEVLSKLTKNNSETSDFSNISINTSGFSSLDLSSIRLTAEEKNKLKSTYLEVAKDNIDNSNFTKIETMESEGYSLEISNQNLKELLIKIFETLKDDDLMLNKLSKIFGIDIESEAIQSLIDRINMLEIEDGQTTITVYGSNKILNKIEIKFNDELKVTISKTSSDDEVSYSIDFESQESFIGLVVNFTGLQNLEKILEVYEISYDTNDGTSYYYNIENTVKFTDNIDIQEFKEDEYIDLNTMNSERLTKLFQSMFAKMKSVNESQMEEANIKTQNPLFYIVPGLSEAFSIFNDDTSDDENDEPEEDSGEDSEENSENNSEENNESEQNSSVGTNDTSGSIVAGMEELNKQTFNDRIKQYEGENMKGTTVKSLVMQIIASNMANEERQIEVTGDVILTGDEVPDSIEASKTYTVKCYTGSDGYINKVEIKEK